jgi:two-component system copper resistance phosphate regulon response regulator CusR
MRILIVEDEQDAASMLAKGLREASFAVDVAFDGESALEKVHVNTYDAVILDLMLPGKNGVDVCREIRALGMSFPILMVTAQDAIRQRIVGLDSGADDYLTKPFDFGELTARIRALLRRAPAVQRGELHVADLAIDTRTRTIKRADKILDLTSKEYALLEYLARRDGEVVGRAEISEHVWDETYDPFSNLIEVYIQRLRRKVDTPGRPRLIHTRRGEGYQLVRLEDEE